MDRRKLFKMLGAAAVLPACDTVDVEVEPKDGAANPDGLPPITPNDFFYVYEQGDPPAEDRYDPQTWTMEIRVAGEVVATMDNSYFDEHVPIEIEHTLQCIGGNPRNTLINNAVWGGMPFDEVLAELGVSIPESTVELMMQGNDRAGPTGRYSTSVPISDVTEGRVWLVWEMNGEALPFAHGAPCRFLVQGRYGTKNVKWPQHIDLTDEPFLGYWEQLNWSNAAVYQCNGFILHPSDGTAHVPGVLIWGTAFAGSDPVERVEITYDDGATWQDTELYYNPGADRWTLWRIPYDGAPGDVRARVRVTTEGGQRSIGPEDPEQANGYNGGMQVRFEVQG